MQTLMDIRPKIHQHVAYLLDNEELLFVSDKISLRFKGKAIIRWFERFGPYLNGEYTLEEICQGFNPSACEKIAQFVHMLREKGVLHDAFPEDASLLSQAVSRHFRSQIELLDHLTPTPLQSFKAFRESRVLLLGSGDALIALGLSLLRNGLKALSILPIDKMNGRQSYLSALTSQVEGLSQNGIETNISLIEETFLTSFEGLRDYDLVVYCSERSSLKLLFELNQRCVDEHVAFFPSFLYAGTSFIGPFVAPDKQTPCWLCAQMRLTANETEEYEATFWQALALGDGPWLKEVSISFPVTRILGNTLAFEIFLSLSGAHSAYPVGKMILQDSETLEVSNEQLVPYPLCPVCSRPGSFTHPQQLLDVVGGNYDRQTTSQELLEKMNQLIVPHFGIFQAWQDEQVEQLPLRCATLVMGVPFSSPRRRQEITSYSIEDLREARCSAFLEATLRYSMALVDTRRMLCMNMHELIDAQERAIAEQFLVTWSGTCLPEADGRRQWMPAYSLSTESLCCVPAAAVYLSLDLNGMFEKTSAGFAIGKTFQEVLTKGTLSALAYVHITDIFGGQQQLIELTDDDQPFLDPDTLFLLRSAQRFERSFRIGEVVHTSPIHVVVIRLDDATAEECGLSWGYGLSGNDAVKMALSNLVARLQSHTMGQDYDGNYTELLLDPKNIASTDCLWQKRAGRIGQPPIPFEVLKSYLQEQQYELLFVDMTPSDIRAQDVLISGKVLLARQETPHL
ncbi:hypothetical protein KDA_48550 [Dictyobacter alpinus]|uniref:YcaO domain-containing protein n=1 Tax=Dictyobacter alpinus TaxID=2014873 RepID=A0A402BD92_9CHLR|nr:TOMM precursor leader peptide-binding protein [Dictyobacter alpinus]GCE29371.1 hypothetical protein KDA_48550 [Dictyobacter alpinus]